MKNYSYICGVFNLFLSIMEVRVYRSMSEYTANKPLYCARVNVPSCFPFEKTLETFRAIYGSDVIIVFLCV